MRVLVISLVLLLTCTASIFAATSGNFTVSADVPSSQGISFTINRIRGSVWTQDKDNMEFGTLKVDAENNIFYADDYYAIDVSVISSASNWQVTHTTTSISNGTTNLDNKVNVTFTKATSTAAPTDINKVSYADSNNVVGTKTQVDGGWLRVYYGLATGLNDNPNVVIIPLTQAPGSYSGVATLTLTES